MPSVRRWKTGWIRSPITLWTVPVTAVWKGSIPDCAGYYGVPSGCSTLSTSASGFSIASVGRNYAKSAKLAESRFAIRLQTVIEIVQQGSNGHITHPVAHAVEFLRQVPGTLARPEERRLGIAPRGGLQQFLQVVTQSEIVCFDQMPSATSPTNAFWRPLVRWQASWLLQFALAGPERSPRKTGGLSNESETPRGKLIASQAAHCRRI